jgi:preprotein translocase subunit SecD
MNRYPLWKYILVLTILVLGLVYSMPNIFGESPAVQITTAKATSKLDPELLGKVEAALKQENINIDAIFMDATGVKVRFADADTQIKAKDILKNNLGKDYVIALNLISRSPSWLSNIHARPMYLGLDLRGGVHFLLQVDMKAALDKAADRYVGDFRASLRKERISYAGVARDEQSIQIKFTDAKELAKAQKIISNEFPDLTLKESNNNLIATLNLQAQKRIQEFALKQNIQTLHNRINELGVAEPIIQQQGLDRVVVQLPGVQDTAKAKEILGRTATLEIRLVDEEKSDPTTLEQASKGQTPFGDEFFMDRNNQPILVK